MNTRSSLVALVGLNLAVALVTWVSLRVEPSPAPLDLATKPSSLALWALPRQAEAEGLLQLRFFGDQSAQAGPTPVPTKESGEALPTLVGIAGTEERLGAVLKLNGEPHHRLLMPGQRWMGWQLLRVSGKKAWLRREGRTLELDVTRP